MRGHGFMIWEWAHLMTRHSSPPESPHWVLFSESPVIGISLITFGKTLRDTFKLWIKSALSLSKQLAENSLSSAEIITPEIKMIDRVKKINPDWNFLWQIMQQIFVQNTPNIECSKLFPTNRWCQMPVYPRVPDILYVISLTFPTSLCLIMPASRPC